MAAIYIVIDKDTRQLIEITNEEGVPITIDTYTIGKDGFVYIKITEEDVKHPKWG